MRMNVRAPKSQQSFGGVFFPAINKDSSVQGQVQGSKEILDARGQLVKDNILRTQNCRAGRHLGYHLVHLPGSLGNKEEKSKEMENQSDDSNLWSTKSSTKQAALVMAGDVQGDCR